MRIVLGLSWLLLTVGCQPAAKTQDSAFQFQLATPQVSVDSILFEHSTTLVMELDQPGVQIYYAYGAREVTEADQPYERPVTLTATKVISSRAFHVDFSPSETITTEVRQIKRLPKAEVTISEAPSSRYTGAGPDGLVDGIKGSLNFGGGTAWMGFQTQTLKITIDWQKTQVVSSVAISTMKNHGSWIFSPVACAVSIPGSPNVQVEMDPPGAAEGAALEFITLDFEDPVSTHRVDIEVYSLGEIPEWHDGRGTTPWLFIDEIIIN